MHTFYLKSHRIFNNSCCFLILELNARIIKYALLEGLRIKSSPNKLQSALRLSSRYLHESISVIKIKVNAGTKVRTLLQKILFKHHYPTIHSFRFAAFCLSALCCRSLAAVQANGHQGERIKNLNTH